VYLSEYILAEGRYAAPTHTSSLTFGDFQYLKTIILESGRQNIAAVSETYEVIIVKLRELSGPKSRNRNDRQDHWVSGSPDPFRFYSNWQAYR
jgi:hypothetical protein